MKESCFFMPETVETLYLKSDSHVPENFCQIKIIPSRVQNNTIICLPGV